MKITVSSMYHIMGLGEKLFEYRIYDFYENLLNSKLIDFKKDELEGWKIRFLLIYRNGNEIMVCKKGRPYVSDKEKQIVIHIPIPSNEHIAWGVSKYEISPMPFHPDREKNCSIFPVNWSDFDNMIDFIHFCIKKGINHAFQDGFTMMGNKIQIEEDLFSQKEDS